MSVRSIEKRLSLVCVVSVLIRWWLPSTLSIIARIQRRNVYIGVYIVVVVVGSTGLRVVSLLMLIVVVISVMLIYRRKSPIVGTACSSHVIFNAKS